MPQIPGTNLPINPQMHPNQIHPNQMHPNQMPMYRQN